MKAVIMISAAMSLFALSGCSQTAPQEGNINVRVGGKCEGCVAVYETAIPFEKLPAVDTLPDFKEPGPRIEISGIIYQRDGHTPAKDVVLYIYHTDQTGHYSGGENLKGWGKRHGYIRSWMKTDVSGRYRFYTLVPASYPNSTNPKHIHPVIKEPGKNEYWIDEFLFADDPLLPEKEKTKTDAVGGSGILKTYFKDGMLHATRDIILGLNVADYPKK